MAICTNKYVHQTLTLPSDRQLDILQEAINLLALTEEILGARPVTPSEKSTERSLILHKVR